MSHQSERMFVDVVRMAHWVDLAHSTFPKAAIRNHGIQQQLERPQRLTTCQLLRQHERQLVERSGRLRDAFLAMANDASWPVTAALDLGLLRDIQRVIDLDAKVSHGTFKIRRASPIRLSPILRRSGMRTGRCPICFIRDWCTMASSC
jgi:hypothetical protein